MSDQSVSEIIDQLIGLTSMNPEELERIFSTQLAATDDNPYATIYDFEIPEGHFERGDLRLSNDGEKVHISLWPRQENELTEDDIDFLDWEQVEKIKINPRIQPEGVDSFVFRFDEVEVTFQLTHESRKLRSIAMDWGTLSNA